MFFKKGAQMIECFGFHKKKSFNDKPLRFLEEKRADSFPHNVHRQTLMTGHSWTLMSTLKHSWELIDTHDYP